MTDKQLAAIERQCAHENCGCSQWVRVEDALPKEDEVVFATGWAFNDPTKGRYYDRARFIGREFFNEDSGDDLHPPTHWMRPVDPEAAPAAPTEGARDAGTPTPDAWWNGIRKLDEVDYIGPSFRFAEDTNHDIPMYAGYNPLNTQHPLLAECVEALENVIGWVPGRNHWHTDYATEAVEHARAILAKVQAAKEGK